MKKLIFRLMAAIAVVPTAAFAAEDKTIAYGETLDITEDTTYLNLVVNGTLNVAQGRNFGQGCVRKRHFLSVKHYHFGG